LIRLCSGTKRIWCTTAITCAGARPAAPDARSLDRIAKRFLDQDVQAALDRRDDVSGMRAIRRADDDGVEVGPKTICVGAERFRRPRAPPRGWRTGLRIENLRHAAAGDAREIEMVRLAAPPNPMMPMRIMPMVQ
jgi:hypothetical protein